MKKRLLGPAIHFLLPSLKLKSRGDDGRSLEASLHDRLLSDFGGYTAAAGNIFGYWRTEKGDAYGEHREYRVAVQGAEGRERVERFLAELAREMNEEEIYCEAGGGAYVIVAE